MAMTNHRARMVSVIVGGLLLAGPATVVAQTWNNSNSITDKEGKKYTWNPKPCPPTPPGFFTAEGARLQLSRATINRLQGNTPPGGLSSEQADSLLLPGSTSLSDPSKTTPTPQEVQDAADAAKAQAAAAASQAQAAAQAAGGAAGAAAAASAVDPAAAGAAAGVQKALRDAQDAKKRKGGGGDNSTPGTGQSSTPGKQQPGPAAALDDCTPKAVHGGGPLPPQPHPGGTTASVMGGNRGPAAAAAGASATAGAALQSGVGAGGAGGGAPAAPIRPLPDHALQDGEAARLDGRTWVKVNPTTGVPTHAWVGSQWVNTPTGSAGTAAPATTTAPGGAPSAATLHTAIQQFEKREPAVTSLPAPAVPVPSAPLMPAERRGRAATSSTASAPAGAPPAPTVAKVTPSRATPPAPSAFVTDPSGRRWTPVMDSAGSITQYVPLDPPRAGAVYVWSAPAKAFVHQGSAPGGGVKLQPPGEQPKPAGPPASERPAGLPGPR